MKDVYKKDHMRKVLERFSRFTISGLIPLSGQEKPGWIQSQLETSILNTLDFTPEVKMIETQPISIIYEFEGKKRKYTTDTGIKVIKNGFEIIRYLETKPKELYEKLKEEFDAITLAFKRSGYEFCVLTEDDLFSKTFMLNLEILKKAALSVSPESKQIDFALALLPETVSLSEAVAHFNMFGLSKDVLCYLVYKQIYTCDLNQPFRNNTQLTRNIH